MGLWRLLHQDHHGRPLWWDGGVTRNKNEEIKCNLNVEYWMSGCAKQENRERFVQGPGMKRETTEEQGLESVLGLVPSEPHEPYWDFKKSCLLGGSVNPLNEREPTLANSYQRLDKVAKEDQAKIMAGTPIPATLLLVQIIKAQNQQAGLMQSGITLIPNLSVGVDIMGIGVVIVSIMGLFGVARGCRRLMNLYFALVLCFIIVQVSCAIHSFILGPSWVVEALEKSWGNAYETDRDLIRDLQSEFHCQGFYSSNDRAVELPSSTGDNMPACAEILQERFGKRLQRLGSLILYIRLIQLTGVFLLSILFRHLAAMDEGNKEEIERTDEESPFFMSEKQIEDETARMPLLMEYDNDLPDYSVHDAYDRGYDEESEDSFNERDRGSETDEDEERFHGRRFCTDRFGAHEYEYRDLPEYTEDVCEPQVYVA
ncbi:hypothetical protein BG011_008000 [Mortierella polycephala]|uniref:Uncharacterized protein n=1 Tax=Mortierella polycephala TaxID=41804 RepID=A0A9P6PRZ9_9FUNG|nr:hypothetical protein BG011_008000 [Mortierella polycephala]